MDFCILCDRPVYNYEPEYCCSGGVGDMACGCMGQPMNPCVCSNECYSVVMRGTGKSLEERRIDAGIKKWLPASIENPALLPKMISDLFAHVVERQTQDTQNVPPKGV